MSIGTVLYVLLAKSFCFLCNSQAYVFIEQRSSSDNGLDSGVAGSLPGRLRCGAIFPSDVDGGGHSNTDPLLGEY